MAARIEMEAIIVIGIIAIGLFVAAFVTKRRFGLLGLALAAGSLLSGIWGYDAGLLASAIGVPSSPLSSAIILSIIVLLPAFLLLFHGYRYKTVFGRLIGASLFTILAMTFLIEPISHMLILQGQALTTYTWLVNNKDLIIGAGLIIAVVDIFLTKPAKPSEKHHEH